MTQEDVNDLMIKNMPQWQLEQLYIQNGNKDLLKRLILKERESCALILDELNIEEDETVLSVLKYCAEAIRARGLVYTKMDKDFQMNDESIDMIKNGGWEEELK